MKAILVLALMMAAGTACGAACAFGRRRVRTVADSIGRLGRQGPRRDRRSYQLPGGRRRHDRSGNAKARRYGRDAQPLHPSRYSTIARPTISRGCARHRRPERGSSWLSNFKEPALCLIRISGTSTSWRSSLPTLHTLRTLDVAGKRQRHADGVPPDPQIAGHEGRRNISRPAVATERCQSPPCEPEPAVRRSPQPSG
jgi:hypothetical protein